MAETPTTRRQYVDFELAGIRNAPQTQSVETFARAEALLDGYQADLSVDETIFLLRICAAGSQAAGRWGDGLQNARRGLELAVRNNKTVEKVPLLSITGSIHSFLGNFHLAIRAFREAIGIAEQEQLGEEQTKILQTLGPVYTRVELHDMALSTFEQAYAIAEKNSLLSLQASAMISIARQHRQMGHLEQAQTRVEMAAKLVKATGTRDLLPWLLHARGELAAARGNLVAAIAEVEPAITSLKKRKNIAYLLRVMLDAAKWEMQAGEFASARERLVEAMSYPKSPARHDIQEEVALIRVQLEVSALHPKAAFSALGGYLAARDEGRRVWLESQRIATQFVEEAVRSEARGRRESAAVNELTMRLIETQAEAQRTARQVARDPLTDALSRTAFEAGVQRVAARGAQPVTLFMLDIDNFGLINHQFGHLAGDAVLGAIVDRLRESLRTNDLLGRFGGDEFLVLCPGVGPRIAATIAGRVLEAISTQPVPYENRSISVSISMGVACAQSKSLESLPYVIKRADAALRRAKLAGKNRAVTVRI